jgi:NADPH-dependent 2,4-dienoyl-CoA reductase/sulfur reductase-like enzyme
VLSGLDAEFVLGDAAVGLDAAARTVTTASGRQLGGDAVVVATGARPRRLRQQPDLMGVHMLRSMDEALALRTAVASATRMVVVGDGVLGTEIAATACGMGLEVVLAGPQPAPMQFQLGTLVAGKLADLHTRHGVRLRLRTAVRGLAERDGRVAGVVFDTGEVLPADLVVVALGAAPATDWLVGSGLRLDDGVVCDAQCRAADGVYAVGDVARWHHDGLGRALRLENRTNATEQAIAVADTILGTERAYLPVPYFWTDQYDVKLQVHGLTGADADVSVVEGDPAEGRFVVQYHRGGELVGVLGWNMPKQSRMQRQHLLARFSVPADAAAPPAA